MTSFTFQPRSWLAAALTVLCLAAPASHASGVDKLKTFIHQTRTARADFSQSVVSRSGRKPQEASGTMMFSRPGKFRWVYEKPYYQLIVGDGERLWVYDRDLNQVTSRKLAAAIGSSPAALLAGDDELEKNFVLEDAGTSNGIEWVKARPRTEGTFESLRIGFSGDALKVMELRDNFGQVTVLTFSRFERNPGLDPQLFRFTVPAGADVIRD